VLGSVVTIRRLRDGGGNAADDLEVRLSPTAMDLVDQKIDISRWYPMSDFSQLLDADWEILGNRDPAYMERQGAVSADRMFDAGMYQQLDYAERTERAASLGGLVAQARLITSVTGTLYNFLDFKVNSSDDHLDILYRNAAAFPESLVHSTVGFMNQINVRQKSKRRFVPERLYPDEIRFRMALPRRFVEAG